jgi:hypothetical protein
MIRVCHVDDSEVVISDDWKFSKCINQQKQFEVTVIDNPNSANIETGLEVKFYINGEVEFIGLIQKVQRWEDTPMKVHYKLICLTFQKILDRRLIGKVFENKTAGYIINYIIDNYLVDEGIISGNIEDGPTFEKVVFNYINSLNAINKIITRCTGYNFKINEDKSIDFESKYSNTSSYVLDDDFIHRGFYPSDSLDEYRNSQIIEGGRKETNIVSEWIPSPKPDGESREFTVKFPIAREPVIEVSVNGAGWVTQTIGLNGIDSGKQFYWTYGSDTISQDVSETVLTDDNPTADAIRVTFYGLLDVRLWYDDTIRINERAGIELNSGRYENVYSNKDITTNSAAVNYAKGLIEKYADNKDITVIIEDDIKDWDINKLVKVEKPLFDIDDWYLIEQIDAEYQTAEHVTYTVKLISGEFVGGWEDYFKKLLDFIGEIDAEDVIVKYKSLNEKWYYQGIYKVDVITLLAPSLNLAPSLTLPPGTTKQTNWLYD